MFVFDQPLGSLYILSSTQVEFLVTSSYCEVLSLIEGIKMPDITVSQRGSPPNSPKGSKSMLFL